MRKVLKTLVLKTLIFVCALYLAFSIAGGIVLTEASLRLRHRPVSHRQEAKSQDRMLELAEC